MPRSNHKKKLKKTYCTVCGIVLFRKILNIREKCRKCYAKANAKRANEYFQKVKNTKAFKEKHKNHSKSEDKNKVKCKVRYALKTHKIGKPKECECCGRKIDLGGHHEDYSKPLEVIWLCAKCHCFIHKYNNRR